MAFLSLILIWSALYLGRLPEYVPKMDAMTYATLAKHILSTGDWKVLHYTPSAFAYFFQHPPLGIWMEALVFKIFGVSDVSMHYLPAIFSLFVLFLVRELSERSQKNSGTWAWIICLASYPFVKFSSDFILDGFLTFFLLAAMYGYFRWLEDKRGKWMALMSVAVAAGFLTKGILVGVFPAALLIDSFFRENKLGLAKACALVCVLCLLFLVPWLLWGGGARYLSEYWENSISYRITNNDFSSHFDPLLFILKYYWPWLIPFVVGAFKMRSDSTGIIRFSIVLCALFFAGFSASGHFYDHYFIPFLAFAAIVSARGLMLLIGKPKAMEATLAVLGVVLWLAILFYPGRLRPEKKDTLREVSRELIQSCDVSRVKEVVISEKTFPKWFSLSIVLWMTPWEATVTPEIPKPQEGAVAVIGANEALPTEWKKVMTIKDAIVLEPKNSTVCQTHTL